MRISRPSQTQQDSPESAQRPRISKILPNRKDSSNPADSSNLLDSSNPTDFRPRLSTNESPLSTAFHSSRVSAWLRILSSRGSPDFFGFVGYISRSPFSDSSVDVLLWTLSLWPQAFSFSPRGSLFSITPTGPFLYACGPFYPFLRALAQLLIS